MKKIFHTQKGEHYEKTGLQKTTGGMCQRKSWNCSSGRMWGFCRNDRDKDRRRFLTTEAQTEARTADVSEAQQESETQTEVQENNTSEDVVEPVGEVTTFTLPDGPEESDIFVQPVADISDDFIRGMDASAVLSVETAGLCIMATMEKSRMCLRHLHSPESIISACVYGMIRMTRTVMAMAAETMI